MVLLVDQVWATNIRPRRPWAAKRLNSLTCTESLVWSRPKLGICRIYRRIWRVVKVIHSSHMVKQISLSFEIFCEVRAGHFEAVTLNGIMAALTWSIRKDNRNTSPERRRPSWLWLQSPKPGQASNIYIYHSNNLWHIHKHMLVIASTALYAYVIRCTWTSSSSWFAEYRLEVFISLICLEPLEVSASH